MVFLDKRMQPGVAIRTQFSTHKNMNVLRKYISSVMESELGMHLISGPLLDAPRFYADVSSQFALSGTFRVAQSSISDFPHFLSGQSQGQSEDRDHNGAKGVDIVVARVDPDEIQPPPDRLMHGGAGLIAGLIIGGLILAYQYARGEL
jgi:hypothetical protein